MSDTNGMTFMDYLRTVNDVTTRFPAAAPEFLSGIQDFSNGTNHFEKAALIIAGQAPPPQSHFKAVQHQNMTLTKEEQDMQASVVKTFRNMSHGDTNKMKVFGALGDSAIIQLIQLGFQFIKANPQLGQMLMTWILQLLQQKPSPGPTPAPQV